MKLFIDNAPVNIHNLSIELKPDAQFIISCINELSLNSPEQVIEVYHYMKEHIWLGTSKETTFENSNKNQITD